MLDIFLEIPNILYFVPFDKRNWFDVKNVYKLHCFLLMKDKIILKSCKIHCAQKRKIDAAALLWRLEKKAKSVVKAKSVAISIT